MCHDTATADKYYTNMPGIQEALKIRTMFRDSMVAAYEVHTKAAEAAEATGLPSSDGDTFDEGSGAENTVSSSLAPLICNDTSDPSSTEEEDALTEGFLEERKAEMA